MQTRVFYSLGIAAMAHIVDHNLGTAGCPHQLASWAVHWLWATLEYPFFKSVLKLQLIKDDSVYSPQDLFIYLP